MIIDLNGVHFRGKFYRDPKYVREEELEIRRTTGQPLSEEVRRELDKDAKEHDFELWVLHHDVGIGLLVARAEDEFGKSGIVGSCYEGLIQFQKAYIIKPINERIINDENIPPIERNFRRIDYCGIIIKPDRTITAGGDYHIRSMNKTYDGVWRMDSVED